MHLPITGVACEIIKKLPHTDLTEDGIRTWFTKNRELAAAIASTIKDAHPADLGACLVGPGCDHDVDAATVTMVREVWDVIHSQYGPLTDDVSRNSGTSQATASALFPGTGVTFTQFHRVETHVVGLVFGRLAQNDEYMTFNRASSKSRAGSVEFEAKLRRILKRNRRDIVAYVNRCLADVERFERGSHPFTVTLSGIAVRDHNSRSHSSAASTHTVADSDVTLNFDIEFPDISYVEHHRTPVNIKGVKSGPENSGIHLASGSMYAWVLDKTTYYKSIEKYKLSMAGWQKRPSFNAAMSDYWIAHFTKDDATVPPTFVSILATDPRSGGLPEAPRRSFPGVELNIAKARAGQHVPLTIGEARLRFADHVETCGLKEKKRQLEADAIMRGDEFPTAEQASLLADIAATAASVRSPQLFE